VSPKERGEGFERVDGEVGGVSGESGGTGKGWGSLLDGVDGGC